MDKYEFINSVIGEGSEKMWRTVLGNDALYDELIGKDTEEIEDRMAERLGAMSVGELQEVAKIDNWNVEIYNV